MTAALLLSLSLAASQGANSAPAFPMAGQVEGFESIFSDSLEAENTERRVLPTTAHPSDMTFFEKHFPLSLDEDLHPELEENLVVIWILHVLFGLYAGPLWIPKLFVKDDFGPDFTTDALIGWLVHYASLLLYPASIVLLMFFWVGWIAATIYNAINFLYLAPVATINLANAHLKANGSGGGGKRKRQERDGRKRRRDALLELPGMPAFAADAPIGAAAF